MVRLTDRPDMTLDVYRGRKTTMQQNATTNKHSILVTPDPHMMLKRFKTTINGEIIINNAYCVSYYLNVFGLLFSS